MRVRFVALLFGLAFGFLMSWAGFSDTAVIRDMLLLREGHVFLIMGSAVAVAAVGLRLLRAFRVRALVTGEPIAWTVDRPESRHVLGSMLFGVGWCLAGTCPGPVAAMVGQGRLSGLFVIGGLLAGVSIQGMLARRRATSQERRPLVVEVPGTAGL
jgi:uncharacterized membrane protein YedE/YeeE